MKFDHTKDYGKDRYTLRQSEHNSWGIWDCMNGKWHSTGRWSNKNEANRSLKNLKSRHKK